MCTESRYVFHSDNSHGWLEVPIEELREMEIYDDISHFSFLKGDYAYLEEDRDALIFIHKKGRDNLNVVEIDDGCVSFIRSFERF